MGYHEGFCNINEIRKLTPEETEKYKKSYYWELPTQFYHPTPSF